MPIAACLGIKIELSTPHARTHLRRHHHRLWAIWRYSKRSMLDPAHRIHLSTPLQLLYGCGRSSGQAGTRWAQKLSFQYQWRGRQDLA
jgi:hypothetical protein